MSILTSFIESDSSSYLATLLAGIGLFLRFRYFVSYADRKLSYDAAFAKYGGYVCLLLCCVVIIGKWIVI